AYAAEVLTVDARLDGDDIAGEQLVAGTEPHVRRLVHLHADSMPEAVEEVLVERLARPKVARRAEPALLDHVTGDLPRALSGHAWRDRLGAPLERLEHRRVHLLQPVRRLPEAEGARHVGAVPAGR